MKRPLPLVRVLLFIIACAFLGAALALKNSPTAHSPSPERAPSATATAAPPPAAVAVAAPPAVTPKAQSGLMAGAEILESRESVEQGVRVKRTVLRTSMKYSYVLLVERWKDANAASQQEAMAADHVVVRLKDGSNVNDLAAAVEAFGGRLKHMGKSPFYVVFLPGHAVGDVEWALERLQARGDLVSMAGPDRLVSAL